MICEWRFNEDIFSCKNKIGVFPDERSEDPPPSKRVAVEIFLAYISDDFITEKKCKEIFFCVSTTFFFTVGFAPPGPICHTGAVPVDPPCFWIEDPSWNRLASMA